jgi:hypothetical protein
MVANAAQLAATLWRRLDDWLLHHHPIAWRCQVHAVLPLSLGTTLLLGPGVSGLPLDPRSAPGQSEVDAMVAYAGLLLLLAVAGWAWRSSRFGMPAPGWRSGLRHLAWAFGCVLLIVMPAQVFRSALTLKAAGAVDRVWLQEELSLHRRHEWWCAPDPEALFGAAARGEDPAVRERLSALQRSYAERITAAGERVGLDVQPAEDFEADRADRALTCLQASPDSLPRLRSRLEGLERIQRSAERGFGGILSSGIGERAPLSLLLAAVVVLLALPSYLHERVFGRPLRLARRAIAALRGLRLGALRPLDTWLLHHRPMLWATQAHRFVGETAILATLGYLGLSLSIERWLGAPRWDEVVGSVTALIYLIMAILALTGLLWWSVYRVAHVPAGTDSELRRLVGAFILATVPLPMLALLAAVTMSGVFGTLVSYENRLVFVGFVGGLAGLPVLAMALAANYVGGAWAALIAAICLPLVLLGPALDEATSLGSGITSLVSLLAIVLPWSGACFWLRRSVGPVTSRRPASRRRVAAVLVSTTPAVIATLAYGADTLARPVIRAWGITDDMSRHATALALLLLIPIVLLWAQMPALRVLARTSIEPQE